MPLAIQVSVHLFSITQATTGERGTARDDLPLVMEVLSMFFRRELSSSKVRRKRKATQNETDLRKASDADEEQPEALPTRVGTVGRY